MANMPKGELRRCPHCGASDVSLDTSVGELRCQSCHNTFEPKLANTAFGEIKDGEERGAGANDIIPGEDVILTYACPSCGAKIIINTEEATSAHCHWCRHIFTIQDQIKNGAVPDLVLPFKTTKEVAVKAMREYIESAQGVDARFLNKFSAEKIQGVYFPYMVIDIKGHSTLAGRGEQTENKDANAKFKKVKVFEVAREFDVLIDDLTIESSSEKLNMSLDTNDVINSILPFDTENAVLWDANYLRGFSSELRNVDIDPLKGVVALQAGDIARQKARETITQYDRGVHWSKEHLKVKGSRWKTAYLPVWLYSYKSDQCHAGRIFYIAYNARTGELAGRLPSITNGELLKDRVMSTQQLRHHHESETRAQIIDVKAKDSYIETRNYILNNEMAGRNDNREIGALGNGMASMNEAERARFARGHQTAFGNNADNVTRNNNVSKTYPRYRRPTRFSSAKKFGDVVQEVVITILMILFVLLAIITDGGGGSSRSSSSSWDYGGWDSGSSWDSGGWDSGGWDSYDSGFDYDW